MIEWPNGARCACAITFDVDADSLIRTARPADGCTRFSLANRMQRTVLVQFRNLRRYANLSQCG